MGTITRQKCNKFSEDTDKVQRNEMAFEELRKGLLDGIYYRNLGNNYCGQVLFDAADLQTVTTVEGLPMAKARQPTIRAISDSGGFSSITKAFIKPSIPFEVEFNGKAYSMPVLTLMHPSPIRVENIQHDAMLTIGDPNDTNNTGLVILVPLVGSLTAGASGAFLSKITRYLSGILTPNPATGQYESIDIPTGSDWNLSSIFPGAPGGEGKTFVSSPGYYVWSGRPPLSLQLRRTETNNAQIGPWILPDTQYFGWVPSTATKLRYIMLSEPVQVNSLDLQTIRMLPATPTTEALSPMEKTTLSYRTAGRVGPNGEWIASCSAPPTSASSVAASLFGGSRESMENKCDPFAPGNFPSKAPSKDQFVEIIIGALVTFGALLAIYFAVKLWTNFNLGTWFADKGEAVGTFAAQVSTKLKDQLAPKGRYKPSPDDEAKEKAKAEAKEKAKVDTVAAYKSPAASTPAKAARTKPEEANAAAFFAKAKAKAKEDADLKEAKAKSKAEAEIKAKEEAEIKAADAKEEAEAKAADEAKAKQEAEERARLEATAAGTGLFTPEELAATQALETEATRQEAAQTKREAELARARQEADKTIALFAKAEEDKKAREAEARRAEEAERKARAEAEAKALAETAPTDARRRTQFAKTVVAPKVPPAILSDKIKALEAERAAAKAAEEAKAKAEAAAKEAADVEAEVQRKSKEAAESASRALERQTLRNRVAVASETKVNTETGEVKKVEDPRNVLGKYEEAVAAYEANPSDETERKVKGLEFSARGVSRDSPLLKTRYAGLLQRFERAKNAVPPARNAREHAPPTETEVKAVDGAIATTLSGAKTAGRALPPSKPTIALSEAEFKRITTSLKALDDRIWTIWMPSITRTLGLNRALWSNRSVWMRFNEEKLFHEKTLVPAVKDILKFKEAVETSGLSDFDRAGYVASLKKFTEKTAAALEETKRRITPGVLENNARPSIFTGGHRRRNRKSTRRYVA